MSVLLVIHEIPDTERRTKVVNTLKRRHRIAIKLTESSFAMHTTLLPVRIFDEVKDQLQAGDQLYVLPICKPYTGYGPRKHTAWLSDYLPARVAPPAALDEV